MEEITINHRGIGYTKYSIYTKTEADSLGIEYKYWSKAKEKEYGISDDGYVAKVIKRKAHEKNDSIYVQFPWGFRFWHRSGKNSPFNHSGRKSKYTQSGKKYIQVHKNNPKFKNLAKVYAATMDADLALDHVLGDVHVSIRDSWARKMRQEVFETMVREELIELLKGKGVNESKTIDFLLDAIAIAKGKEDVSNFMRGIENFQDMLGMKDKHLTKTTQITAGSSTTALLNEIAAEEKKFISIETVEESDVTSKLEAQGEGRESLAEAKAQPKEETKE